MFASETLKSEINASSYLIMHLQVGHVKMPQNFTAAVLNTQLLSSVVSIFVNNPLLPLNKSRYFCLKEVAVPHLQPLVTAVSNTMLLV